jgi:hypothetical protein
LLDAYNAAWSTALRNAGYTMNTAASAFNPNGGLQVGAAWRRPPHPRGSSSAALASSRHALHVLAAASSPRVPHAVRLVNTHTLTHAPTPVQQNVSNVNGAPYYYPGDATGQANLYTNVTVAVDSRLDLPTLFSLLNTTAVAQDILQGISGGWVGVLGEGGGGGSQVQGAARW